MSSEVMRVAVTCGGYSGEADISRKSAAMVVKHMDRARFAPTLVHIERDGWFAETADGSRFPVDKGDFAWTDASGSRHGFDAVFEMVHGTPGEDGRLSAYFELIGLPYTASQPRTLAIGHHKAWTTALLARLGHPVAKAGIYRARHPRRPRSRAGGVGGRIWFALFRQGLRKRIEHRRDACG